MCAKSDFSGYHAFATNVTDHLVNARKFHKLLTKETSSGNVEHITKIRVRYGETDQMG